MVALVLLGCCGLITQVAAVGSSHIQQGDRAYLEWHTTNASAGIPRQTTISAYANAGEQIFLGSSAVGIGSGDIRYYGPDGSTGVCTAQGAGVGLINDYAEEQSGSFIPCLISTTQTNNAGAGIWDFEFISPEPDSGIVGNDPAPIAANDPTWVQPNDRWATAAWHVSVRNASGTEITGRVFARYLAYNMGANGRSLDADYWILTNEGYGYQIDMNGIDPYGFIFFANAEGITDARGNPIYRSMQQVGTGTLPSPYMVHRPNDPDDLTQNDVTYKIFFELPSSDLPPTASEYDQATSSVVATWLRLPTPVPPPVPQNFAFVGVEGTAGQAGTSPLGGYFSFDLTHEANYQISIDVNGNGSYSDPEDRVLLGRASAGHNMVFWDTLDALGATIPAGTLNITAAIQTNVGEIHFPFVDPENNTNGIRVNRFRGGESEPVKDRIYYDDRNLSGGTPPNPRAALLGVPSSAGAHAWDADFGNNRVIDTWTYFPSGSVPLNTQIVLAEADVGITKSHVPAIFTPGQPVQYTVTVTNYGPSATTNSRVIDDVPALILNTTWSCSVPAGQGNCDQASGIGNLIDTTVDLNTGGVATFTINGILSPSATGSLVNTATVQRTNDTTDPNPGNNSTTDTAPIRVVADLELNKSIITPPPITAGMEVEFSIVLRNRGPASTSGVVVREQLPPGLTLVTALPSKGTYLAGIWTVGDMALNEVATLTLRATWSGAAVSNVAEVTASSLPDPDSTPNNNTSSEDDQSSAALPLQIADLRLTKTVNSGLVAVGQTVTFTLEVTNDGPAAASGVRVREQLPLGLALVQATPTQGSYDASSGIWNVGNLALNASARMQIEATMLGVGPFSNVAQVSGSDQYDPDSTPNNDDPSEDDYGVAIVRGQLADLSLSKGLDNPQPIYGAEIVYTLTLRNAGPSMATNVTVEDQIPPGLIYVGSTPSQGSYAAGTGIWTVGNVAANASATLQIRAQVATNSVVVNTAQVSHSDQPDPDSTPGNNQPGEDDQASVVLTPQVADLVLTKSVNPSSVAVGNQATFTITLRNDGPDSATNVEVSEQLPSGLVYVSHAASQGSYDPTTGRWIVGTLANTQQVTLNVVVQVAGVGPYTNTAEVSRSDQPDPNSTPGNGQPSENDQASATLSGLMADLSLLKRVNTALLPPDGIVEFSIEIRNHGPSPTSDVLVIERLPLGATVLNVVQSKNGYDTGTNVWDVGDLAVGEVATLTLTVQLTGPGPFTNTAEVSHSALPDPDSSPDNQNASEDDQSSARVGVPPGEADLELTKTLVSLSKLSDSAVFLISVINHGPDPATNVEVLEQLPSGLLYVNASPSQGSYNPTTGNWYIGTIPTGATVTLQIMTQVTAAESTAITNTAQVSRSDQPDPNSTPGNSAATENDQASVTFSRLTPVVLTSFDAERQGEGVLLRWSTGIEIQSDGFYLYRSARGKRTDAVRITPTLILARGGTSGGAAYSFHDQSALPGVTYTYWLMEVGTGGTRMEYGPVQVAGVEAVGFRIYLPLVLANR
ncbi:hypothetical protein OSCT_3100 [Oscillochloris trichoides DG-6]|uniref:DUF11 domain-containing protein n=1 Tax=Oscillochloris trichoides DG-6 TaxID=765420 RepID=E1IIE9_9CHLR|nr:hypothetical protein OSCT_3100 [Oscillochloris trichoides DG-6]